MSSILTKQLTENVSSNGNPTLLNWKQFSAKAYIDYLQSQNRASDITHEASEYRRKKAVEKVAQKSLLKMQ